MSKFKEFVISPLGVTVIGCACIVAFGIVMSMGRVDRPNADDGAGVPAVSRSQAVEVGGVKRPRSDVAGSIAWNIDSVTETREETKLKIKLGWPDDPSKLRGPYGITPLLDQYESPVIQATYTALRSDTPEAARSYSPFAQIQPFDLEAYRRDPAVYLSVAEPARVWQSAQPGKDVPRLKSIGDRLQTIVQGESVKLQVQTSPNAPVSYLSFDLGAFQNRLAAITVAADDQGIATAEFTGTSGTVNSVRVIAASPVASGNREFFIHVSPRGSQPQNQ